MVKKFFATLSAALLGLGFTFVGANSGALAFTYPPVGEQVKVSTQTPEPGDPVKVTFPPGSFDPGEEVKITVSCTSEIDANLVSTLASKSAISFDYSENLGDLTAGPDGSLDLSLVFNNRGKCTVTGLGRTSGRSLTSPVITVAGSAHKPDNPHNPHNPDNPYYPNDPYGPGDNLPQTGGVSTVPLIAGIGLLILGGIAIATSRKKKR